MRVLDLASGSGEPALTLARHVDATGHVVATDLSQGMLDLAEENARKVGLANISFRQADAHRLPFDNESFDCVTCRLGIMYFVDVHGALMEIRRVLKPEGRAVFAAWGPWDRGSLFQLFLARSLRVGLRKHRRPTRRGRCGLLRRGVSRES